MLNINLLSVADAINKTAHAPNEWEFYSIELFEFSRDGINPFFTYLVQIKFHEPGTHWNGKLFKVYAGADGTACGAYWKKFIYIEE